MEKSLELIKKKDPSSFFFFLEQNYQLRILARSNLKSGIILSFSMPSAFGRQCLSAN